MYENGTWVAFTTSGNLFPHIKCAELETGVIMAGWEDDGATLYAVVPYEGNERVSTPNYYLCRHTCDVKACQACSFCLSTFNSPAFNSRSRLGASVRGVSTAVIMNGFACDMRTQCSAKYLY